MRDQKIAAAEKVLHHNIAGWGTVTIQHGPVVLLWPSRLEWRGDGKVGSADRFYRPWVRQLP